MAKEPIDAPPCSCANKETLSGARARAHINAFGLTRVADLHGWVQLWRCPMCGSYWEMSWKGGGGFDEGELDLRRLDRTEITERWPSASSGTSRESLSGSTKGPDTDA